MIPPPKPQSSPLVNLLMCNNIMYVEIANDFSKKADKRIHRIKCVMVYENREKMLITRLKLMELDVPPKFLKAFGASGLRDSEEVT